MEMDEYISREAVAQVVHGIARGIATKDIEALRTKDMKAFYMAKGAKKILDSVDTDLCYVPVADVQPVNQWISVKDRLPEPEKEVLVWYRYTWGAGFTSYRFGISRWYANIKRWYEGCLPKDIEVLYWQPLPEPPKDGDAE
jgi:hypothetical protein